MQRGAMTKWGEGGRLQEVVAVGRREVGVGGMEGILAGRVIRWVVVRVVAGWMVGKIAGWMVEWMVG